MAPIDRRTFLGAACAGALGSPLAVAEPPREAGRKKMAIVATEWRYLSHAQHMGDRFLVGYPLNGAWHQPRLDVVALCVDQRPEGDLSRQRADELGFRVYPSIAAALRCGGGRLAVDAVLVIGEHGDYPHNDIGQKLNPATSSSGRWWRCSGRTAGRCRSTTTSTSPCQLGG
jgi:hypothetical protein